MFCLFHVASGVGLFNFGRQMGGIVGISFLNTAQVAVLSFNETFYSLMLLFVAAVPLILAFFRLVQKLSG